jgi:hypothetical protein
MYIHVSKRYGRTIESVDMIIMVQQNPNPAQPQRHAATITTLQQHNAEARLTRRNETPSEEGPNPSAVQPPGVVDINLAIACAYAYAYAYAYADADAADAAAIRCYWLLSALINLQVSILAVSLPTIRPPCAHEFGDSVLLIQSCRQRSYTKGNRYLWKRKKGKEGKKQRITVRRRQRS